MKLVERWYIMNVELLFTARNGIMIYNLNANWLKTLSVTEHVFFWISIAASALLILQMIMMLFSIAGVDLDGSDFDADADFDGDGGLSFFSLKAITAFFCIGGWCGFATASYHPDKIWLSVLIAVVTGAIALVGVGFAMRGLAKLQCSGNLVKEKLVGATATVYVSVPPARTGRGKVTLTVQGRYTELDAVTDDETRISCDEEVEILSYGEDFAVVARKNQK